MVGLPHRLASAAPGARLATTEVIPTENQIEATRAVCAWYLTLYHGTEDDPGVARMFCDPARIGHFAVSAAELASGEPATLFRLLVATTMFQRRADLQIERVLRGLGASDVEELTSAETLLRLGDLAECGNARDLAGLIGRCDLTKDPSTALGCCAAAPAVRCALKRHTVLLKRYGHFGKVPTGLALSLREAGARDLRELYLQARRQEPDPAGAAAWLEATLRRAWRVSDKIAAMYLSMLTNPDLCPGLAPWTEGVAWDGFVVIDSNVDLFLTAIGYRGRGTYEARRAFVLSLAREIDLQTIKPSIHAYNPRLVQQAMYLSQSVLNRRSRARDCGHRSAQLCPTCPAPLRKICPLFGAAGQSPA